LVLLLYSFANKYSINHCQLLCVVLLVVVVVVASFITSPHHPMLTALLCRSLRTPVTRYCSTRSISLQHAVSRCYNTPLARITAVPALRSFASTSNKSVASRAAAYTATKVLQKPLPIFRARYGALYKFINAFLLGQLVVAGGAAYLLVFHSDKQQTDPETGKLVGLSDNGKSM
jgi:hypothetical protein